MPVSIYFREPDIVAHALHRTEDGVLVSGLPAFRLDRETSPSEVGRVVRVILSQSTAVIPHPTECEGFDKPVLAALSARSWRTITHAARLCTIHDDDQSLAIIPARNGGETGSNRGFHELLARAVRIELDATDRDLGDAILAVEAQCD